MQSSLNVKRMVPRVIASQDCPVVLKQRPIWLAIMQRNAHEAYVKRLAGLEKSGHLQQIPRILSEGMRRL